MAFLSRLLDGFRPSAISEVFSLCARLKAAGRDIVDLSIGEPDFDTPEPAKAAGVEAIRAGATKYTSVDGSTAMKRAARTKFARDNGLDYDLDQIVIGSGVKPLLFHAMQAVLEPGDEVLVPVPCWASYPGMVQLMGAKPVALPCLEGSGFKLAAADLARAITPRTKLLLLNSPGNPTGAVYSAGELRALAEVLLRHPHVWIFCDDIYEHIVYDGRDFATLAAVEPRLFERTLTFNGVSKCYAMTGWRIGYVGGPLPAIQAIGTIASQADGNPPTISQAAAIAALEGPQDFLSERRAAFQARRDLIVELVEAVPGLCCGKPEGAFYLYANCGELLGRNSPAGGAIETSAELASYLLTEAGVAVVPGAAFDFDPYIRISYAAGTDLLREAGRRMQAACARLDPVERDRASA